MKDRTTDELLLIANNVSGDYSEQEVRRAKSELKCRGISDKKIAEVLDEEESLFEKRLEAAARAEDKRNEKNRTISYTYWEMMVFLLFAPCFLPYSFSALLEPFSELRRLKEEKYDLKFRQRLILLIGGDLIYIAFACGYFLSGSELAPYQ